MTIKYTKEHEWIRIEGESATVGISDYAQEQLGEIVFVELPEAGTPLEKGSEAAVIESVKAASEVYAPASGEVTESNADLDADPGKVNADATGEGWLYRMKISDSSDLDDLMSEDDYKGYVEGLG
ncbi:MAG: glycine cleavage system protein GcvH [Proteobacteria bacterium]|nr:glycine cleavage system protein GcvH [Pseudomonadota bacterium]